MMWEPIETAPRDGSRIMLFDGQVYIGRWRENCDHGSYDVRPGWQLFWCDDTYYSVGLEAPTHWAPLPKPPKAPGT